MKSIKSKIVPVVLTILCAAFTAFAQEAQSGVQTTDLKSIEVSKFDIQEGVAFPVTALDVMTSEIVDEIVKLKRFEKVTMASSADPGQNPYRNTAAFDRDLDKV